MATIHTNPLPIISRCDLIWLMNKWDIPMEMILFLFWRNRVWESTRSKHAVFGSKNLTVKGWRKRLHWKQWLLLERNTKNNTNPEFKKSGPLWQKQIYGHGKKHKQSYHESLQLNYRISNLHHCNLELGRRPPIEGRTGVDGWMDLFCLRIPEDLINTRMERQLLPGVSYLISPK